MTNKELLKRLEAADGIGKIELLRLALSGALAGQATAGVSGLSNVQNASVVAGVTGFVLVIFLLRAKEDQTDGK